MFATGRGKIEGYAPGLLAEQAPLGRRVLRVQELMASTTRARRGLIAWLAALADEFSAIEVSLPSDGSWLPFLRDPLPAVRSYFQQEPAGFVGWGCMGRITHLERALAARAPRSVRGSVVVHAIDPVLPEAMAPGRCASVARARRRACAPAAMRRRASGRDGLVDAGVVGSGLGARRVAIRFSRGDEAAARARGRLARSRSLLGHTQRILGRAVAYLDRSKEERSGTPSRADSGSWLRRPWLSRGCSFVGPSHGLAGSQSQAGADPEDHRARLDSGRSPPPPPGKPARNARNALGQPRAGPVGGRQEQGVGR